MCTLLEEKLQLNSSTHLTSGHSRQQIAGLEGLLLRPFELLVIFERNEPERCLRLVVMAMTLATITLDEWSGTEVL